MRVLFLDFDGVLHPVGGRPGYTLPFEWLPVLTDLVSSTPDVCIVIHSSWGERYSLEELRDFLGPLATRVLGVVGPGPKAEAVMTFLRARPEVDRWLVIDDCLSEFSESSPQCVVVCDPERGLSDPTVQAQIRRWLSACV